LLCEDGIGVSPSSFAFGPGRILIDGMALG